MARIWLQGHDEVADFTISRTCCDYCGRKNQMCVTYHGPVKYKTWTWEDVFKHTIIRKAATNMRVSGNMPHLGIQCGCYAKFQRQIARITQTMEQKAATHA